jgi:transposase-like protein
MFEYITDSTDGPAPEVSQSLDELARDGARRMIEAALQREVEQYLERLRGERDERGRALAVRNGRARERKVTVGAGTIAIRAPRVNDRRPGQRFTSQILPPYMRRSPAVDEALSALYLRGLSTGDFSEGLAALVGPEGAALSATTITRLLQSWQAEYATWRQRSLVGTDYVYVWADGLYFNVRLEEDRLACLVLIGVRMDGKKEVIAIEDGYREATESWASLLRDLKRRGMPAPVLAVGDGALGFWAALRQVYPEAQEQRCWVHKIANVLDKLPKRLQARARERLHEIMEAPDRKSAREGLGCFADEFEAKYPKATDCLLKDAEALLTFFNFPAEHWRHLRTTNPIESPFAGVKARTRQTKGAGSRKAGLAMAFKLALAGEGHWRKVNAAQLVALVRAGVRYQDGIHVSILEEPERQVEELREGIAA